MRREEALAAVRAELERPPAARGDLASAALDLPGPALLRAAAALKVGEIRALARERGLDARTTPLPRCGQREALFRGLVRDRLRRALWLPDGGEEAATAPPPPSPAVRDRLRRALWLPDGGEAGGAAAGPEVLDRLFGLMAGELARWGQLYCAAPLFEHRPGLLARVFRRALRRDPAAAAPLLDHLFAGGAAPRHVHPETTRYVLWRDATGAAGLAALRHSAGLRSWLAAGRDEGAARIRSAFRSLPLRPLAALLTETGFARDAVTSKCAFRAAFLERPVAEVAALALAARHARTAGDAGARRVAEDVRFLVELRVAGVADAASVQREVALLLEL